MEWQDIRFFIYIFFYSIFSYFEAVFRFFFPGELKSLKDEIILITGSANGIGKALAFELIKCGATKLICWDCNDEENQKVVEELKLKSKDKNVQILGYKIDVTDKSQIELISEKVRKEIGHPSIVINNAGILFAKEFVQTTKDEFEKVIQVNLLSHYYILNEFLPKMIEDGKGHIAATCSMSAVESLPYCVPYSSSKFAVDGLMDSLRKEIIVRYPQKKDKIKFTTVYPWLVNTPNLGNIIDIKRFKKYLIIPMLKMEYVAEKYVEGIRRNKTKVYCTNWAYLFLLSFRLNTEKVQNKLLGYMMERILAKKTGR